MACPVEYYADCTLVGRGCKTCAALSGNRKHKLNFSPRTKEYKDHPYHKELEATAAKVKERSQRTKLSLKAEGEAVDLLKKKGLSHEVRRTVASGSKHGDGDFVIRSLGLQFDHKLRTQAASLGITVDEFRKGRAEGTEAWFITNRAAAGEQTAVVLTLEKFIELMNRIS
jgi:hypothetical protein